MENVNPDMEFDNNKCYIYKYCIFIYKYLYKNIFIYKKYVYIYTYRQIDRQIDVSFLANKCKKNSFGLYRNDGLALFKNINSRRADKTRKDFHQLLKENGISLEIEYNLKALIYLDITVGLNTGTYKPYCKLNNETVYIHAKSSHHINILKELSISIKTRLSKLSSNPEASKHHQNILNQTFYDYKLQRKPPTKENENKSKLSKNHKRNIISLNPPFLKECRQ